MTDLMTGFSPIILPLLVLVVWTLVMLAWMAAVRLPYMSEQKMAPEQGERTVELGAKLPKHIQSKADNYNHLLEQPTAFYATAIASAMIGLGDGLNLYLAWAYVVIRVVHSLVQATINKVMLRFSLFLLSTICLFVMAGNAMVQLLN
tara:strand:+ start:1103 stop:1543 length:441 start_codon:yes stop_codon:yes gene_type:complete